MSAIVLIVLLAGLFVLAESGYARLSTLNVLISDVQERQTRLAQLLAHVVDGESSMRGYLLTADEGFLEQFSSAQQGAGLTLDELSRNYQRSGSDSAVRIEGLRRLVNERVGQLQRAISLHGSQGQPAATEFVRQALGKRTTDVIRREIRALADQSTNALLDVFTRWLDDLQTLRLAMAVTVLLNIGLLLVAATFLYRELRRGESRNVELEREVRARSVELAALSSHLQQVAEREKQALARDLHDALGGLLVATKMDVAWIRSHIGQFDASVEQRFARIQRSLDQGIDFKRRVVEQLRPTLLDNMGLFAALRWQFEDTCNRAGIRCEHRMPELELVLSSDAAIGLFRIAQEALTNILRHARASSARLAVEVGPDELVLRVEDNGQGMASRAASGGGQGLAGMRHRADALGGKLEIGPRADGGTQVVVRVPLAGILAQLRAETATESDDAGVQAASLPAG
jgi:signal transduction histidine kinase